MNDIGKRLAEIAAKAHYYDGKSRQVVFISGSYVCLRDRQIDQWFAVLEDECRRRKLEAWSQ